VPHAWRLCRMPDPGHPPGYV